MRQPLALACACGALSGTLHHDGPASGCHVVCHCADCRAAARHFGVLGALTPGGGSPLYQVLPARIAFGRGQDRLACMRLSKTGLHRWYAACCNTPVANTPGTSRVPIAGLWRGLFADIVPLGPVTALAFTRSALPGGPPQDKGLARMMGGLARRGVAALLAGEARRSPFFDDRGRPVATPRVLDPEARRAAYAGG